MSTYHPQTYHPQTYHPQTYDPLTYHPLTYGPRCQAGKKALNERSAAGRRHRPAASAGRSAMSRGAERPAG